MKPLVSILIPAFNAEECIEETLTSAIGQTWPRKEIIVVDDGSTDRTLTIARRFESKDVKIVSKDNQGAAATRNYALSLSQGDYIQWLDADDLLGPDKIARQLSALKDQSGTRTLLSCGWGRFIYRQSRAHFVPTALWHDLSPLEWLLRKMEHNLHMQTATWLVSRELTEAAGPWNTQLFVDDDGEYFCRVLLQSEGVTFVRDAQVFYRMPRAGNVSHIGRSNSKMDAQLRSMRLHIGYARGLDDSERVRAACVTYLQTWLCNFYPHRLDIVRQAEQLAATLGGRLDTPRFSWKYSWIESLFGRDAATRAQVVLPRVRWSLVRNWDRTLFRVENWAMPEPRFRHDSD
jgi:glycosyltransferase involved in cell wall biosynthesis